MIRCRFILLNFIAAHLFPLSLSSLAYDFAKALPLMFAWVDLERMFEYDRVIGSKIPIIGRSPAFILTT